MIMCKLALRTYPPEMWPPCIQATYFEKSQNRIYNTIQYSSPWNETTPLIRPLWLVTRVAGLEGVHCVYKLWFRAQGLLLNLRTQSCVRFAYVALWLYSASLESQLCTLPTAKHCYTVDLHGTVLQWFTLHLFSATCQSLNSAACCQLQRWEDRHNSEQWFVAKVHYCSKEEERKITKNFTGVQPPQDTFFSVCLCRQFLNPTGVHSTGGPTTHPHHILI